MKVINNVEMVKINGGGLTSQFLNAITKAVSTIYGFGQGVESAIRRVISGQYCPIA